MKCPREASQLSVITHCEELSQAEEDTCACQSSAGIIIEAEEVYQTSYSIVKLSKYTRNEQLIYNRQVYAFGHGFDEES